MLTAPLKVWSFVFQSFLLFPEILEELPPQITKVYGVGLEGEGKGVKHVLDVECGE